MKPLPPPELGVKQRRVGYCDYGGGREHGGLLVKNVKGTPLYICLACWRQRADAYTKWLEDEEMMRRRMLEDHGMLES